MTPAKRKAATAANMREMLLRQAQDFGASIICPLCEESILPGGPTIREHMHALGLGGLDSPANWRLVHKHCARRKTIGTRATTAGSDIHLIAKGKRLRGETGQGKVRRTILSRGFDKRLKKPLHGNAVRRDGGSS